MKARIIIILGIIYNLQTLAQTDKILDITTEKDSEISELYIDRTDNGLLESLKFQDQTYSTETLTSEHVSLMKTSGLDIVTLFLKKITDHNYEIIITYLYQFKLFGSDYRIKSLKAYFSSADNRYIILDPDSEKDIHRLHFLSNYNNRGKEVGIAKIETL